MEEETTDDWKDFDVSAMVDLLAMTMDDPQSYYMTQDIFALMKTSQQKRDYPTNPSLFNTMKTIVRPIKDTHALYVCPEQQWKQKVHNYIQLRSGLLYIGPLSPLETVNPYVQDALNKMNDHIIQTLDELYHCNAMTREHYQQMMSFKQLPMLEVNQLDFVPELYHNEIMIEPIVACSTQESIQTMVGYMQCLLQPLIERVIHANPTFATGYDAIQAWENYTHQGLLRSTTRLVKIDLYNLCTTLPHPLLLQTLKTFLQIHVPQGHLDGISTTTLIRLVQLILDNQFCAYDNVLYQQIAGGSITSSLMIGLIDIYLYDSLKDFCRMIVKKKELFGRSFNQILFTWNESLATLLPLLHQLPFQKLETMGIQIRTTMDHWIHFLDAELGHKNGILLTKVYHNVNIEPEALPYISGTSPTHSYRLVLRAAYIRAFLYCSNAVDFETERMYINHSFHQNEASLDFIHQTWTDLLAELNEAMVQDTFINATTHHRLRERLRQDHPPIKQRRRPHCG